MAKETETGLKRAANSNEAGEYRFEFMPPGKYSLQVTAQGFRQLVETNIELQVNVPARNDAALQLGDVTQEVTAIAAPATLRFEFEGEGGHAGAVLMPDRRDAFLAAAEVALAVESAARGSGAIDTLGTVGLCEIFPGAVNSIPSRVRMLADVRDIDLARRDGVLASIVERAEEIAAKRGIRVRNEVLNADAPAEASTLVVEALRKSAEDRGLPHQTMVSRAYHDSLFMARVVPAGMLFIPCRAGVSHRPDEYAAPADIERGVQVLAGALTRLAA
jgi:N-carbamoyl-L-amino-acid hydrolase